MRANLALSTFLTVLLLGAQADALVIPRSSTSTNVPSVVLLLRSQSQAQSEGMVTKRSFDHADDRADDDLLLLLRRAALIHTSDDDDDDPHLLLRRNHRIHSSDDAGGVPTHVPPPAPGQGRSWWEKHKYKVGAGAMGTLLAGTVAYGGWCGFRVSQGKVCG